MEQDTTIKRLLSQDDLKGVISYLEENVIHDKKSKNKLSKLKGQLSELRSQNVSGVLSRETYSRERNVIRSRLIELISLNAEKAEKRDNTLKSNQDHLLNIKNGIILIVFLSVISLIIFLVRSCDRTFSNSGLPQKYSSKLITKKSLNEIYPIINRKNEGIDIDEDMKAQLNELFAMSRGRQSYLEYLDDSSESLSIENLDKNLVDSVLFEDKVNNMLKGFEEYNISFGDMYNEILFLQDLEENRLDSLLEEDYAEIDKMCLKIQSFIDKQKQYRIDLENAIKVNASSLELNKNRKEVSLEVELNNTWSDEKIYEVGCYIYAIDVTSNYDTLAEMYVTIDNSNGLKQRTVNRYLWNFPGIYDVLSRINPQHITMFKTNVNKLNVGGKEILLDEDPISILTPLPYEALYLGDKNYRSPKVLDGRCPYFLPSNKYKQRIDEVIVKEIVRQAKANGYYYSTVKQNLQLSK